MNSVEYLMQAVELARAIASLNAERKKLAEMSTATGGFRYEHDPVKGSHPQNARFEDYSVRKVDIENEIRDDIQRYWILHSNIRHTIGRVRNITVQTILRERYLIGDPLDVIAAKHHCSRKTIERRLADGHDAVAELTGYTAPPRQRMPARERHHIAREMMKEVFGDDGKGID